MYAYFYSYIIVQKGSTLHYLLNTYYMPDIDNKKNDLRLKWEFFGFFLEEDINKAH